MFIYWGGVRIIMFTANHSLRCNHQKLPRSLSRKAGGELRACPVPIAIGNGRAASPKAPHSLSHKAGGDLGGLSPKSSPWGFKGLPNIFSHNAVIHLNTKKGVVRTRPARAAESLQR